MRAIGMTGVYSAILALLGACGDEGGSAGWVAGGAAVAAAAGAAAGGGGGQDNQAVSNGGTVALPSYHVVKFPFTNAWSNRDPNSDQEPPLRKVFQLGLGIQVEIDAERDKITARPEDPETPPIYIEGENEPVPIEAEMNFRTLEIVFRNLEGIVLKSGGIHCETPPTEEEKRCDGAVMTIDNEQFRVGT